MVRGADSDSDRYEWRQNRSWHKLILRVETVRTASGDWNYRASYPELPHVSATSPKVLDAIIDLEAYVSRYLDEDSA